MTSPGPAPGSGVEVLVDAGADPGARETVRRAVLHTLAAEGVETGEISVALLDDVAIRNLNRRHLEHDRVTDVISFPLWQEGEPVFGDIYLGREQAARQAREAGVPLEEELLRLAVHGTLHVLGWNHPEEADARASCPMYRRQEALVRELAG